MRTFKNTILGIGLLSLFSLAGGAGCSPAPLSWEEFRASVTQEPETGYYIVNGDEVVETEAALRAFYDRFIAELAEAEGGVRQINLIVNRVNGADDKYSSTRATNITYCVSKASFGTRYTTVVNAMAAATAAWQNTGARIKFVHLSQYDSNCTSSQTAVWFDVRQTSTTSYLARAFFPSNSRYSRNVLISTSSFGNLGVLTLAGVLRHELGHTLGFRHEHTRPESGRCFEDNNWRALTAYDAASVMHYPQCNGTNKGDLILTSRDIAGVKALYP